MPGAPSFRVLCERVGTLEPRPAIQEEALLDAIAQLTVKGERKFEAPNSESEAKEQTIHRIERRYGSFYSAFTLPNTVDTENVAASYNAGVLKLELAKKPEAQPRQIPISVGRNKIGNSEQWSVDSSRIAYRPLCAVRIVLTTG